MELATKQKQLNWTIQGTGELTLLFVHGWCIDSSYWDLQTEQLSRRFRVVTLDLPGFGKSPATRENWSICSYAVDVVRLIEDQKLMNVVLIGHSMAGEICLEAALTNHPSIIGLIGIDTFKSVNITPDARQMEEYTGFMNMLLTNFSDMAPQLAEKMLFHESTTGAIRERVKHDFAFADPDVAFQVLADLLKYDMTLTERLPELRKKLYLINSDMTPTNTDGLAEFCGNGFEVLPIHATGHYPMIEKPLIFNALLQQAVSQIRGNSVIRHRGLLGWR